MQTENQLLRYLLKLNFDPGISEKIKQILSPDLNWAYFFEQAKKEGMLSLVYLGLSGIDITGTLVPENIRARLESSYYTIAARNIWLCRKLKTILSAFNRADIEVILLKRIVLIHTVYSNMALRPMYDIDILSYQKDFPLVEAKLKELGYNNSAFFPEEFVKDNMLVDVHWDLVNTARIKSRKN